MYLTMNRFKVVKSQVAAFEELWAKRDSHLTQVPGFKHFSLLKGAEAEDHVLYASHTLWDNEASFRAWTKSEAFRAAHSGAGGTGHMYLAAPELELFEAVQVLASS